MDHLFNNNKCHLCLMSTSNIYSLFPKAVQWHFVSNLTVQSIIDKYKMEVPSNKINNMNSTRFLKQSKNMYLVKALFVVCRNKL